MEKVLPNINMREELIQLLRDLEKSSGYKNEYEKFFEAHNCNYTTIELLDFPNYRFIIDKLNKRYKKNNHKPKTLLAGNNIKAELKRMETDGLITINTQEGVHNSYTNTSKGPDYDTNITFTTESIILTTQGKSMWGYYWHKAKENLFAILIAVASLIISIIALIK